MDYHIFLIYFYTMHKDIQRMGPKYRKSFQWKLSFSLFVTFEIAHFCFKSFQWKLSFSLFVTFEIAHFCFSLMKKYRPPFIP